MWVIQQNNTEITLAYEVECEYAQHAFYSTLFYIIHTILTKP